jgi:TetR/AcrR family transcriptional repressor of nem operon
LRLAAADHPLSFGLRVVHERGLDAASVRNIVRAAGILRGSFSNHFASKEAIFNATWAINFCGTESNALREGR